MSNVNDSLVEISKNIRKNILKMVTVSKSSHVGSALSIVEILVTLYFKILNIDPSNPKKEDRDRFILSKGHGCSALYAVLALKNFFPEEILESYGTNGGTLLGHATKEIVPGVEVSTGSLGHGLSIGAGIAFAGKHDHSKYRVFVLLSDGECDEGSVWEAAMFAAHHKLDNLIAIIDYNKLQAFGRTEEVNNLEPLIDKWKSFGWMVQEIDGHNFSQIIKVFEKIPFKENKPGIIIAHTVKGKGISFMENQLVWHYKSPSKEEMDLALKELSLYEDGVY
ncbi:transketolase [Peptococcaceae bacterium SCADC1_2_3]|nr:transketolase [Peptococcaceae bacterium SCADC1_2_3]KFI36537.1 transketolase [Peptococcaceae bacterium SCADC1_2_3]KFI37418.1 transketolase [Peptococcaceae bacterium SCADC1_2_3]HII94522.1 transketolase [Methanofastidiosum sp.]